MQLIKLKTSSGKIVSVEFLTTIYLGNIYKMLIKRGLEKEGPLLLRDVQAKTLKRLVSWATHCRLYADESDEENELGNWEKIFLDDLDRLQLSLFVKAAKNFEIKGFSRIIDYFDRFTMEIPVSRNTGSSVLRRQLSHY